MENESLEWHIERNRLLEAVAEAAREYMKALQDDRKPFPPREEFYKLEGALAELGQNEFR